MGDPYEKRKTTDLLSLILAAAPGVLKPRTAALSVKTV